MDPFPDDVPVRDVHEDLAPEHKSEAVRQAERMFAGLSRPVQTVPAAAPEEQEVSIPATAAVQVEAPEAVRPARVLPDLFALAREEERKVSEEPVQPRRARSPSVAKRKPQRLKPEFSWADGELELVNPSPAPVQVVLAAPAGELLSPRAEIIVRQSQRRGRRAHKLPPGQRWKERRLPRVCWDKTAARR